MSLEIKLKALELSMKGRLDEITDDIIDVDGVQELLTTYFAERDTKPELVRSFKSYSLLYDYLELDFEERDELEDFARENSGYLEGDGKEKIHLPLNSELCRDLVRKQRYVNQLLQIFNFYLKHRKDFQVFDTGYFKKDRNLRDKFGNFGKNLYENARNNFKQKGSLDHLIQLASEQRPEIAQYTSFKEVLKIDGVRKLCEMFDFYLENRKDFQVFDTGYLKKDRSLKDRFGNLAHNLYENARENLKQEGGIDYLVQLASEQRPEIKRYTSFREVLKIDGVRKLCEMFDFYLEHREDFQVFDTGYLQEDRNFRDRFGNLGRNLYKNVRRNFKQEGGINYLVQLTSQKRPEILEYWKGGSLLQCP